jgi:hypothetical protein
MHKFLKFILGMKLYMCQTVPLSIISSYSLYRQQRFMSYSFVGCLQTCMTYTIAVFTVKTPDYGQRNCPNHVEFHSKNKFEKLVHIFGFIIRIRNIEAR